MRRTDRIGNARGHEADRGRGAFGRVVRRQSEILRRHVRKGEQYTIEAARRLAAISTEFCANDVHQHSVTYGCPLFLLLQILCGSSGHKRERHMDRLYHTLE